MELPIYKQCDTFVIGAGLAGIRAAIEISGQHVIICSSSHIFSGSSFYPGTWGLGLVGPKDVQDLDDFKQTIHDVGCHMCSHKIVDQFVNHINSSIDELKDMGVQLKQATKQAQKEFIPCFDTKQRNWNGLLFASLKETLSKKIKEKKIECLEQCMVIDIIYNHNQVSGVVCYMNKQLYYISCQSVIIASGGYGGLYRDRLNTNDICGMGQYLALKGGASLVNMEFMQMMLGFTNPAPKTIYNEKMFKYTHFYHHGKLLFQDAISQEKLALRSTHGPFTSRLPSKDIDIELVEYIKEDPNSIVAKHDSSLEDTSIEFIKTYFDWLKETKKVDINQDIHLGIFSHAANGGIQINEFGETGILGLYACGEVTGGMHGADRIGGLSSANGLVFGKIAGKQVQSYLKDKEKVIIPTINYKVTCIKDAKRSIRKIQEIMATYAFIVKQQQDLQYALDAIVEIEQSLEYDHDGSVRDSYSLLAAIAVSKAIVQAAMLRKESRGSHYRSDYPTENKDLEHTICSIGYPRIVTFFEE